MSGADVYQWAAFILPPVTGVVTWYIGRHKRTSDTLSEMQKTIDLLVEKNKELYMQVVCLREENTKLTVEISYLRSELDTLKDCKQSNNN